MSETKRGNQRKLAGGLRMAFSFFLAMTLFLLLFLCGLGISLFQDRIFLTKLKESNYYNAVEKEVSAKAEEIVKNQGFPTTVVKPAITLKRVYISGQNYLNDTLEGKEAKIDTKALGTDIKEAMEAYLVNEKIYQTKELEEGIQEIVKNVEKEYKRSIQFSLANSYVKYKQDYAQFLKMAVPVLLLLLLFQGVMLWKIERYPHRAVRSMNQGVMGATLMTIFLGITLWMTKFYEKFSFEPEHYQTFVEGYLKWSLWVCFYIASFCILLVILLSIIEKQLKKKV